MEMIDFNEIYTQAVVLFDDPDIKEAYDNNKIMFAKIMYPYLLSSYSNFQNPSIIGMQLSDMQEPDGKQELFKANGIDKKFISEIPYKDNSLYCYYENGKRVNGTYDYNENIVEFENILSDGDYIFERYFPGCFNTNLNITNNTAWNKDIRSKTINILARLLLISWANSKKNFLLDIQNILTDSDFNLHSASAALNSKIIWIQDLLSEVLAIENRLGFIIRFSKSADWGKRNG